MLIRLLAFISISFYHSIPLNKVKGVSQKIAILVLFFDKKFETKAFIITEFAEFSAIH